MRHLIFYSFIIIGSALVNACQYPVGSTELPDPQQFIAIDAEITESYGSVRVTYTLTDINNRGNNPIPVPTQATAFVEDSKGNRTFFNINGTRDTTFKGKIGETYKLFVTADGRSYESTAETMRACPEMDSILPTFTRESNRDVRDLQYEGFDVYVELQDTPGEENFYQWDWIHYNRRLSCDFIREDDQDVNVPCNPYDCWNILYNTRVIVQSDKLRDGNPISQRIVRVPYATPPLRYHLQVEQRSITPTVFDYLKSVETQTQTSGSIFDIPAQTRFSPNIYNVNDPDERILGVFNVFSFRRQVLHIDMTQDIPGASPKLLSNLGPFTKRENLTAPCVEGRFVTRIRPEGWID